VKSNALKTIGGFTELNTVIGLEDYITWISLMNEGKIYFMHECLLGYTLSNSSISLVVTEKQQLDCRKIIYSKLDHTDRFVYTLLNLNKTVILKSSKIKSRLTIYFR
jgi:hypothetical protein